MTPIPPRNKSVSFSHTDQFEIELRQYAEKQGNFSAYVKRLILMDKHGIVQINTPQAQQVQPEVTNEKQAAMKSISL